MSRFNALSGFSVLCTAFILVACSSSTAPPVIPPSNFKDIVYTANAAGSPATVSALSADRTTGGLSSVSGSPFEAGSGSYALVADAGGKFLYVANYFSSDISAFTVNTSSGTLIPVGGSPFGAELGMDSLAIDPSGKFLYAVTEHSENLWAYSIGSGGVLTPVTGFPMAIAPAGTASDSVALDPAGKYLYITNRDSSAAEIHGFSRDATSGVLNPLAGFPVPVQGLANKATFDPSGKFLLVTGTGVFGTAGGVTVFGLDASSGALAPVSAAVQVGTDPGGLVLDASGKFVYIANTGDATISMFTLDSSGGLTPIAGSPVPSGGNGSINGPTGIAADAFGHFIYVCNASNDVSVFSINASSGALTPIAGSPFPAGGNAPHAIAFVKNTSSTNR